MFFHKECFPISDQVLLTDSRFLAHAKQTIFVAIKGDRHDGHVFVKDLLTRGVKLFVVEKSWANENEDLQDQADFWVVNNSVKALQKLASQKRAQFQIPIVGITGSNGKTIVKEWLTFLLQDFFTIAKSPGSYNSQIGVPLSVWQLNDNHDLGIFEAGISQQAEMSHLEQIIKPEIGIFTNIGTAHDEGFRSHKQKVSEKLRLFRASKTLIYCQDYLELDEEIRLLLKAINPDIILIAWSLKQKGSIPVDVKTEADHSLVRIYWNSETYKLNIPFTDKASIENAIHCFFAAYLLLQKKYPEKLIFQKIEHVFKSLKSVAMRLEMKEAINQCYLIDDSYNNDLGGLEVALNFMNQHPLNKKKTVIISDILQSGQKDKLLYQKVNELLTGSGVEKIIGIGPKITKNAREFDDITCYADTESYLSFHPMSTFQNEFVLIKGARPFGFERIVKALMNKIHGTVFEINLDAITHNLNYYRSRLKPKTKMMVMVKASAYGSGSAEIASLLQYHRVDYLAVAYTDEGVELREHGIKLPILVLNAQPESFSKIIQYDLEAEIYSIAHLNNFLSFVNSSERVNQKMKIHLKLDTGMNRLGFVKDDILALKEILKNEKHIQVASIFSHLAASDERKHQEFTKKQIADFESIANDISKILSVKPIFHLANSAGIVNYPEAEFNMVRLGIGLYGVDAAAAIQDSLRTVGTLKTSISQIKHIQKGQSVGYSRSQVLERDSKIATIAIGYADGFDRQLSRGNGEVWINGARCPIVGNVCMDMSMVDITDIEAKEGDMVEIFGQHISIFEVAQKLKTIPYEILTKISPRVKRVFYKE